MEWVDGWVVPGVRFAWIGLGASLPLINKRRHSFGSLWFFFHPFCVADEIPGQYIWMIAAGIAVISVFLLPAQQFPLSSCRNQ